LTYRNPHLECEKEDCLSYTAYIRKNKKWVKVGLYHSDCRSFTNLKGLAIKGEMSWEEFHEQVKEFATDPS